MQPGNPPSLLANADLLQEALQWSRLGELLARWRELPLYRTRLERRKEPVRESVARLPYITKREMREGFPHNFLPADAVLAALLERREVELEYTSGTSEESTPVLFRHGWWDEQERRVLRLNPFIARVLDETPEARRATITSPACNGRACPVVWQSPAQRTFGRTLFVNLARIPFSLGDNELQRMADEIRDWAPQFLDLSPVHGARFALYCEQHGLRFPSLRFILASYEFVSITHRRILERVFGVPVFNLYGSTETGHLLMEDAPGEMKSSHENAILEVVEPDAHGVGDLVATTLTNEYMPLLRYRIGDLVERSEQPHRTSWRVHGRVRDALRGRDGRRITTWEADQCFAGTPGIAHYQLAQSLNGTLRLRYLPDTVGPTTLELKDLADRINTLLQPPTPVEIEAVPLLLPAHSGKFRLTCPA